MDAHDYLVEMAAGVDAAFVVALAICIDEMKKDSKRD